MEDKKSKMSKESIAAKLDVISEMLQVLQDAMGSGVKSGLEEMLASKMPHESMLGDDVKKVSVVAPDEKSLAEGLDVAKEILPEVSDAAEEHDESDKEKVAEEKAPQMEAAEDDDLYSQMQRKRAGKLG